MGRESKMEQWFVKNERQKEGNVQKVGGKQEKEEIKERGRRSRKGEKEEKKKKRKRK